MEIVQLVFVHVADFVVDLLHHVLLVGLRDEEREGGIPGGRRCRRRGC